MDDSYSASELRQRNLKGGSLKDSDMSASQIRARHGVQGRGEFPYNNHVGYKTSFF